MSWLKEPAARRVDGRVAIVTGSAGGIGRAYATALAREGAKVVIADLKGEEGERTAAELRELGGDAIAVTVDVADETSTKAMAAAAIEAYGGVDVLVNNAAMGFARDLGRDGIRVCAIAPGPTDTEAYRRRNVDTGNEAAFISRLALPRKGRPEDQAAGLMYLVSDDAAWVTGEVLSIDGGFSMRI